MLHGHVMIGPHVPTFESGPKALDPVRVGHALNVLLGRVIDGLMVIRDSVVAAVVVGVDRGPGGGVISHKAS